MGFGLIGAAIGSGFSVTVASGIVGGVLSGQAYRAAMNFFTGQNIMNSLFNLTDMAVDGLLGGVFAGIGYGQGELSSGGCSFSGDTPVATDDGEKSISQVGVGDKVLAYDQASGSTGYYTVTAKYAHEDNQLVTLVIDGETVVTTPEHPFFTEEKGWVAAGDLWSGAHVRRADGSDGQLDSISLQRSKEVMYNLTVDQAHTFFVGDKEWLVHNTCRINTQSHHINPRALEDHAIVNYTNWNNNAAYNRMQLPSTIAKSNEMGLPVHNGYDAIHRIYNAEMENNLDDLWNTAQRLGWTPLQAKQELFKLVQSTKWNIWMNGRLLP